MNRNDLDRIHTINNNYYYNFTTHTYSRFQLFLKIERVGQNDSEHHQYH